MSQLQAIASRLRALAEDTSPLAADVEASVRQLEAIATQVESLGRSGVNTAPILAAIQQAQARARSAADAATQVRRDGAAWADQLAISSGAAGSREGGVAPGPADSPAEIESDQLAEISSWLGDINPGYTGDPFDPRSTNCGQCAAAVYSRLSGDGDYVAGNSTLTIPQMESWTGKRQIEMSAAEIEASLRARGPGAHAVVGIDRSSGPGHWFNAYFDGDQVVTIDGQSGTISPWPPDYGNVILWDAGI